ncbi:group II intron reverse transcriptase/maturase [Bacillus sp. BPN334]|uniref:group II intron reverse transcriptase/maturase n=1 Tax=Bacillus sp. BPN334 TaxID=2217815 RepID=UPI0011EEDF75|nr:group II intron reverse transcriptase/maturase [Bacillus sp. BPN334]KAA0794859.1 group II intron reverse transcriptase/maturase [Bacillus sp. BPN334]
MNTVNMKSAVSPQVTQWNSIQWKEIENYVKKLRQRIYRAEQFGNKRKVRKLQRLMLRSKANLLLSIKRVTQINQGKRTAGIDGITTNTPEDRVKLFHLLKGYSVRNIKAFPVKRTYIPKKNGKKRPLGIPVIKDRIFQNVVKNALEPQWECRFESMSYGFRPKRSAHDAMANLFLKLSRGTNRAWIFEGDFQGCFDNLNHEHILSCIEGFPYSNAINQWLNAGCIDNKTFYKTETGTPQGGIISPLLANIALHGMEQELGVRYHFPKRDGAMLYPDSIGIVRYADDFVIVCNSKEEAESMYAKLQPYLDKRGLKLAEEKTRVVHITDGFDFLGFNFRQYPTKEGSQLFIKPSNQSVKKAKEKISEIFKSHRGRSIGQLIRKLNPVITGIANYWSPVVAKVIYGDIDSYIHKKVMHHLKYKHHRKGARWINKKYFHPDHTGVSRDKWLLTDPDNHKNQLIRMRWTPIVRHVLIKYKNSPDDANLKKYFAKRDEKIFNRFNTNSKRKLAKKTKYKCRVCNNSLVGDEPLESNHIVPKVIGGKDEYDNLELLHCSCHKQHHALLEWYGNGKQLPKVQAYLKSQKIPINSKKAVRTMLNTFKKFKY